MGRIPNVIKSILVSIMAEGFETGFRLDSCKISLRPAGNHLETVMQNTIHIHLHRIRNDRRAGTGFNLDFCRIFLRPAGNHLGTVI